MAPKLGIYNGVKIVQITDTDLLPSIQDCLLRKEILILIAISVYVLVAIVKKNLKSELTLYTILQILSVSLFEKIPILQAFTPDNIEKPELPDSIQLNLFN